MLDVILDMFSVIVGICIACFICAGIVYGLGVFISWAFSVSIIFTYWQALAVSFIFSFLRLPKIMEE